MFIKLLMYFYRPIQLPINCLLMGLITHFMFKVQINYMWFQKNSKWIKSYELLFFILYVVPNFSKIVCAVMCFHPFWFGIQWHTKQILKWAKLLYI